LGHLAKKDFAVVPELKREAKGGTGIDFFLTF
jgi:hypothetical protein